MPGITTRANRAMPLIYQFWKLLSRVMYGVPRIPLGRIIFIAEKCLLPTVPTLRYVIRQSRNN